MTPEDTQTLIDLLTGFPDQLMGVLLVYLTFSIFWDMMK